MGNTKNFRIDYVDPETGENKTVYCEFEDTPHCKVEGPNFKPYHVSITARQWAEDYVYSLADKGQYTVTEVKEKNNE